MGRDMFERHAVIRLLVYATATIATLYAGSMIWGIISRYGNIILMIFLAWIIVFVLQPVSSRLERLGAPRVLAVALVYLALLALVGGVIVLAVPTLSAQVTQLASMLSGLFSAENTRALSEWAASLLQGFGISSRNAREFINQAGQQIQSVAGSLAMQSVTAVEGAIGQVVTLFVDATIVIVLSFYMMLDGGALVERLIKRLPPKWIPDIRLFQAHVNSIFGGFLRAALVITLTYAAFNWVIMAALGQPNAVAVLFSLLAGMLLVIPWIGGIVAIIPPAALVFLNSPSPVALRNLIILVIALIIAQQVVIQLISPRVMGVHIGLHPLLVFIALLVGAREAGVWGMLFAPPAAAVAVAMLDTFFERWRSASGKYPNLEESQPDDHEKTGGVSESQTPEDKHLVEAPT